jgi:hypothetical protein
LARRHAGRILETLDLAMGTRVHHVDFGPSRPGAVDWALSGAMALTGREAGPPLLPIGAPASAVRGALAVVRALSPFDSALRDVDERVLGERAAFARLSRRGPRSPGGSFRLLPTKDGWVGVNLPRPEDRELVGALTRGRVEMRGEFWPAFADWLTKQGSADVTSDAQFLGLPMAAVPARPGEPDDQSLFRWGRRSPGLVQLRAGGARRQRAHRPLVVLLASLWAGPLAAHLLGLAGARVATVESTRRHDGARRGPADFYDLLHADHEMVIFDLPERPAVRELRQLIAHADLVIDGSRPRAMPRLGIDVDAAVASGTSWISITGYGRTGPWANRPAFGDDAAAAAGLVAWDDFGPVPAGDAIADPLTGVHAAVLAFAALSHDRAWLFDIAMRDIAAAAAGLDDRVRPQELTIAPPQARRPTRRASGPGADTERLLVELGIRPGPGQAG